MPNNSKKRNLSFSITARTAILLGRENISSATVAVIELVKNAYDADAKNVLVRFRKASSSDGTIEIIDNGQGMNWKDITSKWMVIGTDNKQIAPFSAGGRRKVGEKGIGRFALDRLATETILETTSKSPRTEPTYRLVIDWEKFSNSPKRLNQIKHPIEILEHRQKRTGTNLTLRNLRDRWTRQDYEKLYNNLVVLIPPFEKKLVGFNIRFDCDEAQDLSGNIRSPLAKAALFKIKCNLDVKENIKIVILKKEDAPTGKFKKFKEYDYKWSELFDKPANPSCGPVYFELHFYLRESTSVQGLDIKIKQIREYLDIYGGVRIYRDGFRIKPYGEPGGEGDWLGLNPRRVKHPAGVRSNDKWVLGENQIAAGVFISIEENPNLKDQTNREGLIINQAYADLRAFTLKCIEIFETDRQAYERQRAKDSAPVKVDQSINNAREILSKRLDKLDEAIDLQPNGQEKDILKDLLQEVRDTQISHLTQVELLYQSEQKSAMSKMQLLQNTATVGIAVTTLAHEVLQSGHHLIASTQSLNKRVKQLMLISDEEISENLSILNKHGKILYAVASFALGHIDRDKRRTRSFPVDDCIEDLINTNLREMCATNNAEINFIKGNVPDLSAFPYEIESVITNFVTNSIAAFQRGKTLIANRKIEIETQYDPQKSIVKIISRDNGPGIPKSDKDRIFNIYSTKVDQEGKPYGTGIGLVIVKDIVESHHGSVSVNVKGTKPNMKGAELVVSWPVPKERDSKKGNKDGRK